MEAIISLDQIGLTFHRDGQSTEVLRDFSLDVPAGRFVAVIGPSGVGKSTLLRVIAGLLPPTTGRVAMTGGFRWRWCSRTRGCCPGARS